MTYLLQEAVASPIPYNLFLNIIGVVGFITAVVIGSIAWYNSKRPTGWENAERPDIVPDINKEEK